MKKTILLMGIICSIFVVSAQVAYTSGISDTFAEKYSSLRPRQNSSVGSDYLFEQIALGGEYTVLLLDQMKDKMKEQNLSMDNKVDTIIEKFEILINQNQKIIDLLEKQTNKQGE
jgi:hypothetical protein